MKHSPGPLLNNDSNALIGLIYQLPEELKLDILSMVRLSDLNSMSCVNKSWQNLVQQMARTWVELYFPYLKETKSKEFNNNPLKVLTQEFKKYEEKIKDLNECPMLPSFSVRKETFCGKITMEHVIAALSGDKTFVADVATHLNKRDTTFLYALLVLNGHRLPKFLAHSIKQTDIIELALTSAASRGFLAAVKRLLTEDGIPKRIITLALTNAAENGHLLVVKHLLSTNGISKKDRNETVDTAAINGQLLVMKYLLSIQGVSYANIDYSLFHSAANGHLDVMKYILSEDGISIDALNKAVHLAASMGQISTLQHALTADGILQARIEWSLVNAAFTGSLPIVTYLLNTENMSNDAKENALTTAITAGMSDVANEIKNHLATYPPLQATSHLKQKNEESMIMNNHSSSNMTKNTPYIS